MKLVSRYLLGHLRRPWFYIMAGFCIIAVLVDLFRHFVDFMEAGTPFGQVALYYAILLPTYLPYLLPVSILLALLYALWQLGKNSELIAMRASGLSLSQIISPYVSVGLLASLFLLLLNEGFNPWALHWTRQFENRQGTAGQPQLAIDVGYMNVLGRRLWRINSFDLRAAASYEMRGIKVTQQRPDLTDEFRLDASRGRWVEGHWWFEDVEIQYYDARSEPAGPPEPSPSLEMTLLSETPQDFINEIKDSSERSALEILRFIDTHQGISKVTRNRLMVDYHYRLAAPWLCLIVILVGFPLGTHTGRQGMGIGILLALLTFFGYYILMGLCLAYGKRQLISPFLAGWFPVLALLVLGLTLLRRLR